MRTGIYERLLCESCDNKVIGGYEDYGARLLSGAAGTKGISEPFCLRIGGIDYTKAKLFFLSMLWRMGISSHAFFRGVDLGPHAENLRSMILEGRPGRTEDYGVSCVAPTLKGKILGDFILAPDRVRPGGRTVYRCVIGGLVYSYFIGKHPLGQNLLHFLLCEDGSLPIVHRRIDQLPYLRDICAKLQRAIKIREAQAGRGSPIDDADGEAGVLDKTNLPKR